MGEAGRRPSGEAPSDQPTATPFARWAPSVLLLLVAFVTLPEVYRPLGPAGLDPAWQWAVNRAVETGWVFGEDIVFTYGPLAYLIVPLDIGNNLLLANGFYVILQALFASALVVLYGGPRGVGAVLAFFAFFVCADHLGLGLEGHFMIVVATLALVAARTGRRLLLAVAAGLGGMLLFVKMSLGVAAAAILAAAVAAAVLVYRRPISFAVGMAPYPVVVVALAGAFFHSPGGLASWMSLSLDFVSDYSVANSILGPTSQVIFGLAALAVWSGAAFAFRRHRDLLALNLVFLPVVLIQFRLAFVRQDTHQLMFVPFLLAVVALSMLVARGRRQVAVYAAGFALLLVGGSLTGLADPVGRGLLPTNLITGGSGGKAIVSLIRFGEVRARLAAESRSNLAPLVLPDTWIGVVRGSRNGVGTLPWEIQYCPANGLEWNPTPTIQLYSAYTAKLDRWSAEKYAGSRAPEFIIDEYVPVGKRHKMIDAPATWREIFIRYELRDFVFDPREVALLERRSVVPEITYRVVREETVPLGSAGIEVPPSDGLLFAELDLELNSFGRMQKSLFRVPLIYLVMYHASGHTTYYRLTPGPAENGVLINRFPKDFVAYRRLWYGVVDDPVLRFTIDGPGLSYFRATVPVTWRELSFVPAAPRSSGDPPPG